MPFVETEQFKQMISYNPYATTKSEKKKIKYILLDSIKDVIGDKWNRFKEGTRQTFDMLCFLGAELGFVYASDEYLSERHDISDRTVRNRLRELEELGQVVKVYKRTKRCNGRGKPVYLFVNHPYFKYWMELLGLELNDFHTDFRTENEEKPCDSKDEGPEKVSTYSLPNFFYTNHLNNKRSPYIKFVPKSLQHYQAFFGKQVKDLYGRVWLAAKKLGVAVDQEDMQRIGLTVLEQLKQYVKGGKQLTDNQLCKLAYRIGYNQLTQGIENGEIYDMSRVLRIIKNAEMMRFYQERDKTTHQELDELGVF